MNPIRTIRRLACIVTALAAALAAAVMGTSAAFAATQVYPPPEPPPGPLSRYETVVPGVPAHTHAALTVGVTGWQVALIAVGAAIVGAVVGVLLARAGAAHGHRPATAA